MSLIVGAVVVSYGVVFLFGFFLGEAAGYVRGITGPISKGHFDKLARERGYTKE